MPSWPSRAILTSAIAITVVLVGAHGHAAAQSSGPRLRFGADLAGGLAFTTTEAATNLGFAAQFDVRLGVQLDDLQAVTYELSGSVGTLGLSGISNGIVYELTPVRAIGVAAGVFVDAGEVSTCARKNCGPGTHWAGAAPGAEARVSFMAARTSADGARAALGFHLRGHVTATPIGWAHSYSLGIGGDLY